ncbi:DUF6904 family protein [Mucilaginibacter sp. UYCu711]|uniref:DUF6904 family protein n=1 Tax=Mucilaginibacter sp. UYCu711 TaxID=3156339 RepID=UPI003D19A4C1
MLTATPTKRGTGISIWGDDEDLRALYQLVHTLAGDSEYTNDSKGGRVQILHCFAYEIRHAYQESRLTKPVTITEGVHQTDFGFNFSWIDLLFTLNCLRFNAAYTPTEPDDQTTLDRLEQITRQALQEFDTKGAQEIERFVGPHLLNVNHPWIWQFNQQLEIDYMEMNVNKTRFRNIPNLLRRTEKWSPLHSFLIGNIKATAKELNCDVYEIEYLEYPNIKW